MKKHCAICGRKYSGQEIYCGRCGRLLEMEPNRCSAKKTELCRTARLAEDDRYCPYCREPATYVMVELDGEW